MTLAESLEHLWHLYRLKRYELAEDMAGKVLQDDPENAEILALLALVASARGRKEGALVLASDALALSPDHAWYYYILGVVNREQDELYGSIECLHEAVRLDASCPEYYRMLSRCHLETWQLDHAHWCVLKALQLEPEDASSLLQYGIIKYRSDQFAEAEIIFRQVLSLEPENALCHEYLGWMKLNDLETASAKHYFTQSLQHQPETKSAQFGLEKAIKLHQQLGGNLFQRTERRLTNLEQIKEGNRQEAPNPQLNDMIQRDCENYSEQPRSVVFTQSIQFGYDPLKVEPVSQKDRDEAEYAGMSANTQMLVLKLFFALLAIALLMAIISFTK